MKKILIAITFLASVSSFPNVGSKPVKLKDLSLKKNHDLNDLHSDYYRESSYFGSTEEKVKPGQVQKNTNLGNYQLNHRISPLYFERDRFGDFR